MRPLRARSVRVRGSFDAYRKVPEFINSVEKVRCVRFVRISVSIFITTNERLPQSGTFFAALTHVAKVRIFTVSTLLLSPPLKAPVISVLFWRIGESNENLRRLLVILFVALVQRHA